jgi:PTS system galactitol-specific IIB component
MFNRAKKEEKVFKEVSGLVVCADGVATSTIVRVALKEGLEDMDIEADLEQGRVLDAGRTTKGGNFDFVISTAGTDLEDVDIPIISGVPLLTGIGKDKVFEQIKDVVDKKYAGR